VSFCQDKNLPGLFFYLHEDSAFYRAIEIDLKRFDKEEQNGLTIRHHQNWFAASAIQAGKRNLFYV
jgi:hypothetical protein